MSPNSPPSAEAALSTAETTDLLARELGGDSARWSTWLANDRKPGRVNRRLPQEPGPGRPRYNAEMVNTFIAEYKKEHLQSPQGQIHRGPSRDGRFVATIAALRVEEGAEQPAVLLVIPKPLQAFVLTAEEARRIAARLINAASEIDPVGQVICQGAIEKKMKREDSSPL
jgi:hypothetical protein